MFFMRHLFLFAANNNFNLLIKHIPGLDNVFADLLSRLQVQKFQQMLPTADHQPSEINQAVWNLSPEL